MDFFGHQDAARRRTKLLLFYYVLAVLFLVLGTYAAALITLGVGREKLQPERRGNRSRVAAPENFAVWNFPIFAASALGTLTIVGFGSLWRVLQLRSGGSAVAEMLGGRRVELSPDNEREQMLRNVVEEMAIASGTPVPEIFLLEHEAGINAFAAGYSNEDMAVGVTRGCLEKLSRDELQGVIGHEFSHMLNGDSRLNIKLIGVLHGILCLYIVGRILLSMRSRSSKDRNPLPLFGLALVVLGGVGVFFAHLIQAAISRQREFLADASAVQFTRNPNGLAGALKKIGGFASKLGSPQADAASHLFFANGLSESWFGLTATHPPLEERIRRIEPAFDGNLRAVAEDSWEPVVERPDFLASTPPPIPFAGFAAASATPRRIHIEELPAQVGTTIPVEFARGVIAAVPDTLRAATHDAFDASALALALVFSAQPDTRRLQKEILQSADARLASAAARLADELTQCDRPAWLPLLSLSLPALRTLSRESWERLADRLDQIITCDGQVELFEFVVKRIITRHLEANFAPQSAGVVNYYSFGPLAADCALLLSALAQIGSMEAGAIRDAFARGFARLPFAATPRLLPLAECGVEKIDAALTRASQSVPYVKKAILEACAATVASDGTVSAYEAELLRAVAESLGCPMPPFIAGV